MVKESGGGIFMKKLLFGLIVGLLMFSGLASALPQETARMHQVVVRTYAGDEFVPSYDKYAQVHVIVHNDQKPACYKNDEPVYKLPKDMKHMSVTVVLAEEGLRWRSQSLRVKHDKRERFIVPLELPYDLEPGVHYLRITTSNDNVRRVKYREIIVS